MRANWHRAGRLDHSVKQARKIVADLFSTTAVNAMHAQRNSVLPKFFQKMPINNNAKPDKRNK